MLGKPHAEELQKDFPVVMTGDVLAKGGGAEDLPAATYFPNVHQRRRIPDF